MFDYDMVINYVIWLGFKISNIYGSELSKMWN
jgi:hypothetical protein